MLQEATGLIPIVSSLFEGSYSLNISTIPFVTFYPGAYLTNCIFILPIRKGHRVTDFD